MPGRQQICILCRGISHPARIPPRGGRAASQLRSLEPYDASKLVLDLDAADCKFVRRYEDESKSINAHEYKPLQERKSKPKLQKSYNPYKVEDVYRPAPIDFLTYTFWRDDSGRISSSRQIFRYVTTRCLRRGVGTYEDRTKWLFAYEALPYKLDRIHTRPYKMDTEVQMDIGTIFQDCKTFSHIRRITALITRNLDGCRFVAKYATFILQTLGLEVPRDLTKQQRAGTMYINSVIQRLETMGVDPGPGWYGAALYHAATKFNFLALNKYLGVAGSKDGSCEKIDNTHIRTTLEFLFDLPANKRILERLKDSHSQTVASLKPDLLRILTGWDKKGVPQSGEIQNNCFAMLLRDDEAITNLYFKILIRLKADSALRHELNHGCLAPLSNDTGSGDDLAPLWRSELKARILLHFRQPLQALQLLLPQKQIHKDRASALVERVATASLPISGSRHLRRTLVEALAKKYVLRPAFDIDEQRLSADLEQFELYTPETMSRMLSMLSTYWPLHSDQIIRNLICVEGPSSLVCRNAIQAISRRLEIIGEVDEEQYDDRHRVDERKDVKRLRQLRADLQSLSFWTEAEDDLLKTLVKESQHGEISESEVEEDWEVMAETIAKSLPERKIPKGGFMCEFLRRRYKKVMWAEGRGAGILEAEVSSRSNEEEEADKAVSLNVSDDVDATRSPGGQ